MKDLKWQVLLGLGLIALSALIYFIHFLMFKDFHHIIIYLVGDIAFVPVEVLLVTLIIHRALEAREKKARLEKVNMVIEAFYSEIGIELLRTINAITISGDEVTGHLKDVGKWGKAEFDSAKSSMDGLKLELNVQRDDLQKLKDYLGQRRGFLMRLWENPQILEHESYADVLRASLHLTEELNIRQDMKTLTDIDVEHLSGDILRAYRLLAHQWVDYMWHLKTNYPYLFSLAVRLNPFDKDASPYVLKV